MLSKQNEKFLRKTIKKLIERFYTLQDLSQIRINKVIFMLCQSINEERVFLELAAILRNIRDLEFVEDMIDGLTKCIAEDP